MFNQVFFEKVLVQTSNDVTPQRTPLFEALLSPQTKQLAISSELLLSLSRKRLLHYAKRLSNVLLVPFNDIIWNRLYSYLKELYNGLSESGSNRVLETAV
jgi:hypothetical protein